MSFEGTLEGDGEGGKSRYAHDFLLGIGQLKDSLDTSRRRQLELEKEKKKLLLSLSHDINTAERHPAVRAGFGGATVYG